MEDFAKRRDQIIVFYNETNSYSETGRKFEISRQRVHQIIKGYKNFGASGRERIYKRAWKDKCQKCKKNLTKHLHHINKDNLDDRKENLLPVCIPCHKELHLTELGKKWRAYIPKPYVKRRKNKKCDICGINKHYAKGLCYSCYRGVWRNRNTI